MKFSRCPPFEEDLALDELADADLLLAAVLLPPYPDGLVAHRGDDGLIGGRLLAGRHRCRGRLDVDGLAAAEPALLVEELPVLDLDLADNAWR